MDDPSFENAMSDYSEPSIAATENTPTVLSRNEDPLTVALRSETGHPLSLDDLVHLNRADPPSHDFPSTVGTRTATVLSSQNKSSITKPTSAGTSYVVDGYTGKVKTYASSLSAAHGSGSEAEAEQDIALFGVGDQFENSTLRGVPRARRRPRENKMWRPKKMPPVIRYGVLPVHTSSEENMEPLTEHSRRYNSKELKTLRIRKVKKSDDMFADEQRVSTSDEREAARHFSRARANVVIGLCVFIALTLTLSVFAAHHTGKGRLACTKGIIFSATILISLCTVLVMILARRALQEALLAGLLEFVIGFALVMEIRDFMEHVP